MRPLDGLLPGRRTAGRGLCGPILGVDLCVMGFRGLGFRSLGFGVLGFRGLGFRSLGFGVLGFRGLGFRSLGFGVLGFRGLGFRSLGFGVLGFRGLGVPLEGSLEGYCRAVGVCNRVPSKGTARFPLRVPLRVPYQGSHIYRFMGGL